MGAVTARMEQSVVDVVAGRSYFCYSLEDPQDNLIRFHTRGSIKQNILIRFNPGIDTALIPSCEVNVENRVGPLQTFDKREQWRNIVFSGMRSDRHIVHVKDIANSKNKRREDTYLKIRISVWRIGAIPKSGIRRFVLSLESATTSSREVLESEVLLKTNEYATQETSKAIFDHSERTET
jgi:hypothetical protein